MPRGNDTQEAINELRKQFEHAGNAEDLIKAERMRRVGDHARVSLLGVNEDASAELDFDAVAKAADVPKVVDAQVRGNAVSYVWEDADGRWYHGSLLRDGSKLEKPADVTDSDEVAEAKKAAVAAKEAREAREAEGATPASSKSDESKSPSKA